MRAKSSARSARIAAQMQRSLAELLRRHVKDPRVGNVTVTGVQLAHDLSVAHIRILPFAGGHPGAEVLEGLRSAAGFLRGQLARELELRHAPRLEFELDAELERAYRVSSLIDSAIKSDRSRDAASAAEAAPGDAGDEEQ
jgi:ribosome-binding factor A